MKDYEEITNLDFSNEELEELNNYKKYIKYRREGLIKTGNKNWLIVDTSKFASMKLIKEITLLNQFNRYQTNLITDTDFISQKYGFDENKFLSSIKTFGLYSNILVISSSSLSSSALAKYGDLCTFYIDYSDVNTKKRQVNVKKYVEDNHFHIEDENLLYRLEQVPTKELNRTLTKAFIKALNNNTNILKDEYIEDTSSDLETYISELNNLVGLKKAKKTLFEIINYLQIAKKRDDMPCLNMCFMGNPGTGKTTVAKLIGKILSALHVFNTSAPFIVTSREQLVGRYIGQTEEKVLETVNNALGGILFIDEAYSLISEDDRDYGAKVIDVLVNQMDIHKHDLCVIFAGYKEEMLEFLKCNSGLDSRIPFKIEFEDYNEYELLDILKNFIKGSKLNLEDNTDGILLNHFEEARKYKNFGNGRYVRNFVERLKIKQANRLINENSNDLYTFTKDDIENTIKSMKKIKSGYRQIGFKA